MARLAKYTNSVLVVDADGNMVPAEGAAVHIYAPDTTTDRTTYSDSAGSISTGAPITLSSDGMLQFYVRSQDRTFDINVVCSANTALPQFTTFTIQDESATHDDSIIYSSEYATLQAAITAAGSGAKVIIDDPVVTLSAPLTISAADLVIEGESRANTVTLGTNANCDVFDIAGTRLAFRNFTIDGNAANQNGAGPYYGFDFGGAGDVLVEDVYVTNVKGDGYRINGLQDSTLRRARAFANKGYGFSSDSSASGARIVFQDTLADTNGQTPGMGRLDGYHFEPPMDDMLFDSAQSRTNPGRGFSFVSTTAVATKKRIKLDGCYAIGNGGTTYEGLMVLMSGANGTALSELQINGGQFSDNGLDGIHLYAPDTTDPGTASRIMNFTIDSPVCARNGRNGIHLEGRLSYGTVTSPVIYQYAQLTAGSYGIRLAGALDSNNQDDNDDATRCRWISIVGPVITYASGAGALDAIILDGGTKHCSVRDVIANGQTFLSVRNEGKLNIIQSMQIAGVGAINAGGFPAWPLQSTSDYGAYPYGGFWIVGRTRTVSTTETRVGSNRITSLTRVLSLVPLDITGAAQLMGAGASGWYHKLSANVSGTATGAGGASANMGYLTLYTVGVDGAYSTTGEFAVFCAEALV